MSAFFFQNYGIFLVRVYIERTRKAELVSPFLCYSQEERTNLLMTMLKCKNAGAHLHRVTQHPYRPIPKKL